MSNKKPLPINVRPEPDDCPVCGKVSYSAAGIHPQCAVRQADANRKVRITRSKAVVKKAPRSSVASWQRICPKCKTLQHVRKKVCSCGHSFAARPPTNEGDLS